MDAQLRWPVEYDFTGSVLDLAFAAQWLAVWRREEAVAGRSELPRRLTGPRVRREGHTNHYLVGRLLFRQASLALAG